MALEKRKRRDEEAERKGVQADFAAAKVETLGYFVPYELLLNKYKANRGAARATVFKREGLKLTPADIERAIDLKGFMCPCGHCQYYAIEFLPEGKFATYHHRDGKLAIINTLKPWEGEKDWK